MKNLSTEFGAILFRVKHKMYNKGIILNETTVKDMDNVNEICFTWFYFVRPYR